MRDDEITQRLAACSSDLTNCRYHIREIAGMLCNNNCLQDLYSRVEPGAFAACDAFVDIDVDNDKRNTYVKQLEECSTQLEHAMRILDDLSHLDILSSLVKLKIIPCPLSGPD